MENTFKPRCCGIWSALSKEQLNFADIINEFIDNARAAAATRITVHLVQTDTDEFSLEVTDDGYGMAREDFDQIFSVGALRGALAYKRCGMGLKVALANADPENLSWEIRTKTTNGECSYIGAPYAEQMAFESLNPKELKSLRRSGTIIIILENGSARNAPTRLPLIVSPCIRCAAPEKKNLKQILIFKSSVLTVISH